MKIRILPKTAAALKDLGFYIIGEENAPEVMGWIVCVLRHMPDDPRVFPHGKWGTIQSIEAQLGEAAAETVKSWMEGMRPPENESLRRARLSLGTAIQLCPRCATRLGHAELHEAPDGLIHKACAP